MLKTPALVLKKQNLGETDRILTIFSPVLGKKRVIAKAVRRPLSKLAGHLDTMMLSQIMLTDEDDLPKITGAVLAEPFDNVRNDLTLLNRAYFVTRLIERVILEDVAERPIFQLTVDTLSYLDQGDKWPVIWLNFLSKLANRLGLAISDFHCYYCGQPIRSAANWLIDERKLCCQTCARGDPYLELEPNSIKMLKLLAEQPYSTIQRYQVPGSVAREVEEVFLRLVTEWLNKPWHAYSSLAGDK